MSSTAPLDLYIRRALCKPNADVFSHSDYMSPPTLKQGVVNYVLTFRGCFNPPHEGHKATLCHGFFRGGRGIRLIAAIVFPLPDQTVARKYGHDTANPNNRVLTMQERINLINSSGIHGGWHWCHPRGTADFDKFKRRLAFEAAKDDFTIEFVTLTGPDHVGQDYDDYLYSGPTIVVGTGDSERTTFRVESETSLRPLVRYNDWFMEPLKAKFIQNIGASGSLEWLEQKLLTLFPREVEDLPLDHDKRLQVIKNRLRTNIWRLGQTRFCQHSTGPLSQWVRYVPTRFFGMTGGAGFLGRREVHPSSTRLRRMLVTANNENDVKDALSPLLLLEYIRRHKRRTELKRQGREATATAIRSELKEFPDDIEAEENREALKQRREEVRKKQTAEERVAFQRRERKALEAIGRDLR